MESAMGTGSEHAGTFQNGAGKGKTTPNGHADHGHRFTIVADKSLRSRLQDSVAIALGLGIFAGAAWLGSMAANSRLGCRADLAFGTYAAVRGYPEVARAHFEAVAESAACEPHRDLVDRAHDRLGPLLLEIAPKQVSSTLRTETFEAAATHLRKSVDNPVLKRADRTSWAQRVRDLGVASRDLPRQGLEELAELKRVLPEARSILVERRDLDSITTSELWLQNQIASRRDPDPNPQVTEPSVPTTTTPRGMPVMECKSRYDAAGQSVSGQCTPIKQKRSHPGPAARRKLDVKRSQLVRYDGSDTLWPSERSREGSGRN